MLDGLTRRLARTDWGMLLIALALLAVGLVMVYSSSYHFHLMGWADVTGPTYHFVKQLRYAGIGLAGLVLAWAIDYHLYKKLALAVLAGTLAILVAMALRGRWIEMTTAANDVVIYGSIQHVEVAKLGAIIYIAVWLESKRAQLGRFSVGTVPFIIILGGMAGLIILQPDYSTALLLIATASAMFFVAGANMKHFVIYMVIGVLLGSLPLFLFGYGEERYTIWLEGPFSDPMNEGYQILQSLRALSLGGLPVIEQRQSQQKLYLGRFSHTDFVFSIICEEFGFLGAVAVIGLYGLWVWRGLLVARNAPDVYGRLLAVGLVCWTAFQAILSIAVATNSAPVTGTVLPFMSYGGSSLVTALASVGVLLNISRSGHKSGKEASK